MSQDDDLPTPPPQEPDAQLDRVLAYLDSMHQHVEGKRGHHLGQWQFSGSATAPVLRSACTECAAAIEVDYISVIVIEDSSVASVAGCPYGRVSREMVTKRNLEWEAEKQVAGAGQRETDPGLDGQRKKVVQFLNETRIHCEHAMQHELGKWLSLGTPEAPYAYTSCQNCGASVTVLYDSLDIGRDSMAYLRPCIVTSDLK